MRISHAHKLIYFSIPKTASEAVRAYLDPCADDPVLTFPEVSEAHPYYSHMRPCEVAAAFDARGLDMGAYLRVVTVRNPFARLASLYKMARRGGPEMPDGQRLSFDAWIAQLDPTGASVAHLPQKWYAHGVMSQSHFLSDDGALMVDHVFRVEDQLGDLQALLRAHVGPAGLGSDQIERRNNAPRSYDWREMYTDETRAVVERLYADDLARWGYGFAPT